MAGGLFRAASVCCPLEEGLRTSPECSGLFKAEANRALGFSTHLQHVNCFAPTVCQALYFSRIITQEYVENQSKSLYGFRPYYCFGQGVLILSYLNPKQVTIVFLQFNWNLNMNAMFQASEFLDLVGRSELLSMVFVVLYFGSLVAVKSWTLRSTLNSLFPFP